jgi:RHS repeat-associated protein
LNARNQLVGISGPNVNASFVYDGLGRREKKTINGNLTEFLFDGLNPVQETSGVSVTANILPGLAIDEFLIRTDIAAGATSSFLTDALGSAVALTDSTGAVQTEYTYEPFGKTSTTGAANSSSYQYTGRENDATGLNYYRARYYQPQLQRFISEDPIGFAAGDPNLFGYAGNSPTNYRDPTGNFVPTAAVVGVLCATGAVTGAYAYSQLSGRKTTLVGYLGSAAAGCLGGIGVGWGIGIGVEALLPSLMLGGEQGIFFFGLGEETASIVSAKALETRAATISQTFSGSALGFAQQLGLPGSLATPLWSFLSRNYAAGAGSALVLAGSDPSARIFIIQELPVLLRNSVLISAIFYWKEFGSSWHWGLLMAFRHLLFNIVKSDAGFTVKIRSFKGYVEYREGKRVSIIPVYHVYGRPEAHIKRDTPITWKPPYSSEAIPEDKRKEILQNIVEAMRYRKYPAEIVWDAWGSFGNATMVAEKGNAASFLCKTDDRGDTSARGSTEGYKI